ncbi:retrotransposon-related protein [Tanacetum coccineum]
MVFTQGIRTLFVDPKSPASPNCSLNQRQRQVGEADALDLVESGDISILNSLIGHESSRSLQLWGMIGSSNVHVLIDNGSTHNFVQPNIVERLRLPVQTTKAFKVYVGMKGPDVVLGDESLRMKKISLHHMQAMLESEDVYGVYGFHTFPMEAEGDGTTPKVVEPVHLELEKLLSRFDSLFEVPTTLPPHRVIDHRIYLLPNTKPVNVRPPFSSPVLLVKKKDRSYHFCIDYQALNAVTVKDKFSIPTVDEMFDELGGAVTFIKLDLRARYHQIRVHEWDTYKTAYRTHDGHYKFLVMPFGLTNAPSTFQATMNRLFLPYLRKFIIVLFDDLLVYSTTLTAHLEHLECVLTCLQERQFYVKRSKCVFGAATFEYLGHIISEHGVEMDPKKILVVREWHVSQSQRQVQGFLGLAVYYQRFIKGYATLAVPLTDLLRNDGFKWEDREYEAFEALKQRLSAAPVLGLPDFNKACIVETDASGDELKLKSLLLQEFHNTPTVGHGASRRYVSMDFITGMPLSKGFSVLIVVVDRFSKYAHFAALPTNFNAHKVAEVFVEAVVKHHGIPKTIVSDRDPIFVSKFWTQLFKLSGTQLNHSTAYHPQMDGQTEVVNRGLEQYLRAMVTNRPDHWVRFLSWAKYCYNTNYHNNIKMTPYQELYGKVLLTIIPYSPRSLKVADVEDVLVERDELLRRLRENLLVAKNRMEEKVNLKRREVEFNVGDKILVKLQPYRQLTLAKRLSHKWAKRRISGPNYLEGNGQFIEEEGNDTQFDKVGRGNHGILWRQRAKGDFVMDTENYRRLSIFSLWMQRERRNRDERINPEDLIDDSRDFDSHRSMTSSIFGGRDPFDDPFFKRPFGKVRRAGYEELDMIEERNEEEVKKDVRVNENHNRFDGTKPQSQSQSQNHFSFKKVTYGGINGAYYTATTTISRRYGVVLEDSKEADKTTGQATHRISKGIHDKGHSVTRKLGTDGKVDTVQTLHNLNEDELTGFEQAWEGNADRQFPGWNYQFNPFETAGSRPFGLALEDNRSGSTDNGARTSSSSGGRPKKVVRINID